MKKRSGFERLRGVAAMAMMGAGAMMGGSARAASRAMPVTVTQISFGIVTWSDIQTRPMFSGNTVVTSHGLHLGSTTKTGTLTHIHSERAFGVGSAIFSKHANAFDNVLNLVVGGHPFVNPDATVDLTGTTVTTDPQVAIVPHIDATVQYWFDPIRPVVRALYTLQNTSASPVTTDVLIAGNLGSNLNTTVEATQSGDHTIDNTDRWYVTSDNGLGAPLVMTTRYGSGASVKPTNALTPGIGPGARKDNYGLRYHVTVPANGTVRVLVFHEIASPAAGAADALATKAADFESLDSLDSAGLLNGLTATQRSQIVNYGSGGGGGGGGGTLGLLGLAALGVAAARRRRTDRT